MRELARVFALSLFLLCISMSFAQSAGGIFTPPGCEKANRPAIPNGVAVTKLQLLEAKVSLESYLRKADEFIDCLKRYEDSFGENIDGDKRVVIITSHNKVVDEMYLAGDEFNIALRKFNRRSNP